MEGEMKGGREAGAALMKETVMAGVQSFSCPRLGADVNQQNRQTESCIRCPRCPAELLNRMGNSFLGPDPDLCPNGSSWRLSSSRGKLKLYQIMKGRTNGIIPLSERIVDVETSFRDRPVPPLRATDGDAETQRWYVTCWSHTEG